MNDLLLSLILNEQVKQSNVDKEYKKSYIGSKPFFIFFLISAALGGSLYGLSLLISGILLNLILLALADYCFFGAIGFLFFALRSIFDPYY